MLEKYQDFVDSDTDLNIIVGYELYDRQTMEVMRNADGRRHIILRGVFAFIRHAEEYAIKMNSEEWHSDTVIRRWRVFFNGKCIHTCDLPSSDQLKAADEFRKESDFVVAVPR